ncbi:DASH complex subunit Ask1-domain-containing protein [Aspergillus cavernicola]|uniref:DASH complex subunit ASK1 n=1 Tax=Aspergillus cavernicola TaxID=176166 RepID=A0ABR4IAZ4_9EURO
MSRPSSMAQRPLTLTEELEKLEQSITLTLQEIDHNFSRAHRIVTTNILPVVEQYAEASRDVWEGSKFWKQFFEASANVSLSGYEERPDQDTTVEQTLTEDDSANISQSSLSESESYQTPSSERIDRNQRPDDIDLTSLSLSSHSTPRAALHENPLNDTTVTSIAHPSPYDLAEDDNDHHYQEEESYLPTTPGKRPARGTHHQTYDDDLLSSSPFIPPVSHQKPRSSNQNATVDPVMHHLLDKTYRVQATPLRKGYDATSSRFAVTPKQSSTTKYAFDDSPMSSPEPEAPQLNSELFSPLKPRTPNTGRNRRPSGHQRHVTPQPGTSVLTPAKGGFSKGSDWDSDDDQFGDDDEDEYGLSPPKTMQFHIPQSRLMKTPAKEASRRIVEQLLFTAGANDTIEDTADDQSPSVIRRMERLEDDTF